MMKKFLNPETRPMQLDWIYAACALLLFLHHFVVLLFYPVWAAGAQKLTPFFILFAAASVLLGKLWKRKECWILLAFWGWMLLRVFLEKRTVPVEAVIILSAALYAFFVAYPAFLVLRPSLRKTFLTILAGIWVLITAVLAVWGVALCWTSAQVKNLVGEFFGINSYGRLVLFSNPNVTGGFYACGVFMAIAFFTLVKNKVLRTVSFLATIPMVMATSLSGTRSASIAISVAFCLLICLLLQNPLKKTKFRYGILALVFVLCFGVLTLAQIRFNGYFVEFRNNRTALVQTATAEDSLEEIPAVNAEESAEPPRWIQQRGGLNFSSLDDLTSGRISIWADGFRYFRQSPRQILLGDSILNPGLKTLRMNHYHNIFLQVLYESGILGFALFAAFLVVFLIHAFRLIREDSLPLWQRFLPAPALSILVMDLMDCLTLFANGHPPMTLLWFFMGATIAVSNGTGGRFFRSTAINQSASASRTRGRSIYAGSSRTEGLFPRAVASVERAVPIAPPHAAASVGRSLTITFQQAVVVALSLAIAAMAAITNRHQSLPILITVTLLSFAIPCLLTCRYIAGKQLVTPQNKKCLWPAFALLALLWLLFSLNNSSIGVWRLLLANADYGTLLGVARPIRGDEWAVWTPQLISQAHLGFPSVNTAITAGAVDPTLVAIGGLPAWNLAAVFKPLYWGFLLLGAERGYSLMTLLRFSLLFAVSFLAAKRYTRGNTSLSVAAAFLITLAPYVQWWFSQGICEVLIFSQASILCWYKALEAPSSGRRIAFGGIAAWSLGCFLMVLYPAWLIPMTFFMLAILIRKTVKTAKERLNCQPGQKNRPSVCGFLFQTFAPLLPVALLLFLILRNSWPTLLRIRGSVYPGQRLYTGGDRPLNLFTGLYSLTFPAVASMADNTSELANFLSFFPAGLLLAGFRRAKTKKTDGMSVILLVFLAVFSLLALVPLPAWLTRFTLLSQCVRPGMILSLANLLLLLRSLGLIWEVGSSGQLSSEDMRGVRLSPMTKGLSPCLGDGSPGPRILLLTILSAAISVGLTAALLRPPVAILGAITLAALPVFALLYSDRFRRLTVVSLCLLSILSGAFVNPVQKGLAMVNDLPPVALVASANLPDDTVIAVEADWPAPDALLFSGKRVLNSTFPYADPEKWRTVDPEGRWEEVWNRLCHVSLEIGSEMDFSLIEGDHISATLTLGDLRLLGTKVLLTRKDYPALEPVVGPDVADDLRPRGEMTDWKLYWITE